jgi:hypothetical protein
MDSLTVPQIVVIDLNTFYRPKMVLKSFIGQIQVFDAVSSLLYVVDGYVSISGVFSSTGLVAFTGSGINQGFTLPMNGNISEYDSEDILCLPKLTLGVVPSPPFNYSVVVPVIPAGYQVTSFMTMTFGFPD